MSLRPFSQLLASLSFFACTSLFAAPITVGVSNVQSVGEYGDSGNTTYALFVGANALITGVSYNVSLTAYSPSWLSELALAFTDVAGNGLYITPGTDNTDGTATYSGSADLFAAGQDFRVGADGYLYLEFFETFNNVAGSDGQWNAGTITFDVPEPASIPLVVAGLVMMGCAGHRRARASSASARG